MGEGTAGGHSREIASLVQPNSRSRGAIPADIPAPPAGVRVETNHMQRTTPTTATLAALALAASFALAGCYTPAGGYYPRSGGGYTYISTESSPVTITVYDTRTAEPFFKMEIPVGKQLTMNFLEGKGDDPVLRPDRMVWSLWDAGTMNGRLTNQLTCPPAAARRIAYDIRSTPEYREEPPEFENRIDAERNNPPWWTPAGGPLPPPVKWYN